LALNREKDQLANCSNESKLPNAIMGFNSLFIPYSARNSYNAIFLLG